MSDAAKTLFEYALAKIIGVKEEGQAIKVSVSLGEVTITGETVPQPVVSGGRSSWGKRAEAPSDLSWEMVKAKIAPLAGSNKVEVIEGGGRFIVRPAQGAFLGDDWKPIMEALRPLGFQWSRENKQFEVEHPNASKNPVPEAAEKTVTMEDAYKAIEESGFMDVLSAEARDGLARINIKGSLGNDYKAVADTLRKHGFAYNRELKNCFTAKLKETGQDPHEAPLEGGAPQTPQQPKPQPKPEIAKDAPSETITSKDSTVLGKLNVIRTDAQFTPSMIFTVDTPPFKSFLVDRVFEGMKTADAERVKNGELTEEEAMDYEVTEDNYKIESIYIRNYGGERRLREIASSLRWTFDKMYDKSKESTPAPREEPPEPSFNTAGGEPVMCAEEVKARAAVEGLLGSDQLDYVVDGGVLKITPKKFIADAWGPIHDVLKPLGSAWVQVKPNHWEIPVKAVKAVKVWPKVVGLESAEVEEIISQIQAANPKVSKAAVLEKIDTEIVKAAGLLTKEAAAHLGASEYLSEDKATGLSIESVEKHLTEKHGELAMQRLAVTENSTFIMVEPYQSLTPTEQAAFDKTMRGLGAEYKGDNKGWFITKPKARKP